GAQSRDASARCLLPRWSPRVRNGAREGGRPADEEARPDQAFVVPTARNALAKFGSAMVLACSLIDANQKLASTDERLDRSELRSFYHARDGAELARRITLSFDAACGVLLDRRRKAFHPLVLSVVEGRGRELHDELCCLASCCAVPSPTLSPIALGAPHQLSRAAWNSPVIGGLA